MYMKLDSKENRLINFLLQIQILKKTKEKNNIKKIFFSEKGPTTKVANPKNKDKNNGTNMREKGIKPLNISSCVKDIEIQ